MLQQNTDKNVKKYTHVFIKWNIDAVWEWDREHKEETGRRQEGSFPSNPVNWKIEWMFIKVVYQTPICSVIKRYWLDEPGEGDQYTCLHS